MEVCRFGWLSTRTAALGGPVTQTVWQQLDPVTYNDGVFYVPAKVELQPRLPDWGHPDEPDLRDRLVNDRPHGMAVKSFSACSACVIKPRKDSPGPRSG